MEEVHEETTGARLITLTDKGKSYFETNYAERYAKVTKAWDDVDTQITQINECDDVQSLKMLETSLELYINRHFMLSRDLIEYCERAKTAESNQAADKHRSEMDSCKAIIDSAMRLIGERMIKLTRNCKSVKSKHSHYSSHHSDVSSEAARTKAKAEAAKARLRFAKQEIELKKKQALLNADLELLAQQRETAAAEAEAEAYQTSERASILDDILPQDDKSRVNAFVEDTVKRVSVEEFDKPDFIAALEHNDITPLNPNANIFVPNQSVATDFTRFLLKKDLLLSRLTCFDDRAENYRSWKISFQTVMRELNVTPLEELDLLLKWTGLESRQHVLSIKAANVSNPVIGLQRTWTRLEDRYGCPEMLEASLKWRVECFPKLAVKDSKKLYELSDLVSEIDSVKRDDKMKSLFAHYDSSTGVTPIVNKLPYVLQERWTTTAVKYMKEHDVAYPPFSHFAEFLRDQSKIRNNPSFAYDAPQNRKDRGFVQQSSITSKKTDMEVAQKSAMSRDQSTPAVKCPWHLTNHPLNKCKAFRLKPIQERMQFLKRKNICFRCCESSTHVKRDCKKSVLCRECNQDTHPTALHVDTDSTKPKVPSSTANNGGEFSQKKEPPSKNESKDTVSSSCTRICGTGFAGKSCAKMVQAKVYTQKNPNNVVQLYVLLDDQSNRSLANSKLFDLLKVDGEKSEYILSSCSGKVKTSGRRANDLVIESLDRTVKLNLPTVTECSQIPDNRNEIPTPDVAYSYPHLEDIAKYIPPLNENADIMMLIGRDIIRAHHVIDHRIGPANTPYAQKLPLGWTIVGESCLGSAHLPDQFGAMKTNILINGRGSLFEPCTNEFKLQETPDFMHNSTQGYQEFESFGCDVFVKTKDDEKPGLSQDDRSFLKIMDSDFRKDESGNWTCPLPFRNPRPRLQNNYSQVLKRARMIDKSLQKDTVKKEHFVAFMDKMFQNGHAEIAPALQKDEECWFLPIFGVYHPRKRDQVRVVFDSAAKFNGVSLNDVLLSGPDLTNSLLGVLLRFRREPVAVVGDIEQMFYGFHVNEEHRNFLRFLWHEENDLDKPLIEYRMCVHIFGNTASPAIATYGLRKAASLSTVGFDVTEFVHKDFYVDDGLTSLPTVDKAIDLIRRTQEALRSLGNLRLHKIASNREEVMHAFPSDDLAKDIKNLDLGNDLLPIQRSLGISWCLQSDKFLFQIADKQQPYTKRAVLSTINSIFDPLGFLAPVVIEGKLLLRKLVSGSTDWDQSLPEQHYVLWDKWVRSLQELHGLTIPRTLLSTSYSGSKSKSVYIFSDASEEAIAAVAYLRATDSTGDAELGFILGKTKVAPTHGHTIPRLELCGAVLAVEIAESIANHLNLLISDFTFYTDSRVVLGYIHNQTRRFYTYVANRVERIRSSTKPQQWFYTSSENNPADQATRSVSTVDMPDSSWLRGPAFLLKDNVCTAESFEMQNPDDDKEVRPLVINLKTEVVPTQSLGSHRFSKFSHWKNLVEAIARLQHVVRSFHKDRKFRGWYACQQSKTVDAFEIAQKHVLQEVQKEVYNKELVCLKEGKPFPKSSSVAALCPYLGNDGLLRVGGRLTCSDLSDLEKHPILVPGRHHIAILIVRYFHEKVHHQGRHITEGIIRSNGYWITGAKSLVSSVISKCVKCKKLRGALSTQQMANLPPDRLEPGPPFSNVGVDCFGPWQVVSRRTRGGLSNSKRWAVMFTCLTTRAIHIEVVEELSSSSFINALRRFLAIRGPVKQFRSDRGTNFVGSTDDIGVNAINVEDQHVKEFLYSSGTKWLFNPPHASHMGGVWERMIGVTRRILDSLLMDVPGTGLTHEVLVTFLSEACAIVNARPLVSLTADPDNVIPLTPSLLLTQKPQVVGSPTTTLDPKDMYRKQWKRVQILADMFWNRWRTEYLQTLQTRRKWLEPQRDFVVGDVVLLRDKQLARNLWPMGVVQHTYPGTDNKVRKVDVRVVRNGSQNVTYTRPIAELVLLIPEES